ncbi:hypothetical protein QTP88_025533 [Uroleucon formosanum]
MARGIYSSWKIPVCYFLAHSAVKHAVLRNLIINVLQELFDIGMSPKVLICDQCSNNQSALKSLNVTENKPYFYVNENKIISLFDTPHLLKSVTNSLIGNTFKKNEKIISFNDFITTYDIDKKNKKSNALLKITEAHIHPNSFQKMSVKLAAQIFSHSMASALRTCISTAEIKSKTASDTADFINFMNNLFDCLNSRNVFSENPYNCALTNSGVVKQFLVNATNYFNDLFKINSKGKVNRPQCFSGFTQTINGVLSFFNDEKNNNNIQFLFTNRLNQDTLENLFSIFRQKGGYNKNPTARTIRTSFRSTCVFSLITSKGTNCEISQNIDDPALVQDVITPDKIINEGSESSSSSSSSPIKIISEKCDTKKINETITLEDCSVTYFSGYLAYKCITKFDYIESNNRQKEVEDDYALFDSDDTDADSDFCIENVATPTCPTCNTVKENSENSNDEL